MSSQGYPPAPSYSNAAVDGVAGPFEALVAAPRHRYWLHALLFLLTLVTTTVVGAGLATSFDQNRPFDFELDFGNYYQLAREPFGLLAGLPFSLALLTILLAHEFGHYIACRYSRVDASLPYFLPAPTLIGTLGAFIRIRAPIYSKRSLFDIGIAGPIAGFVVLLPALAIGLAFSKVVPGIGDRGDLVFGTPLILRALEWLVFPGVPVSDIYLHPVARAAWVGILATSLNLLPIGQLDGGHILYSFFGNWHKWLSRIFVVALVVLGRFTNTWSWYFWAAFLFFFGMRHPTIYDTSGVGKGRTKLGWLALALFVLSFTPAPIQFRNGL